MPKWGNPTQGSSGGTVTYAFVTSAQFGYAENFTGGLDASYQSVVQVAFQTWANYADIEFVPTSEVASADIVLGWASIDGVSSTVGLAYREWSGNTYTYGEVYFDTAETWSYYGGGATVNFLAVAIHEIGHVLGLDHNNSPGSIMNPRVGSADLSAFDIANITSIYGVAQPYDSGYGTGQDLGGYNYGWHTAGWYAYGTHYEAGWDFGYYNAGSGWEYGWYYFAGWEYGWYQYGAWTVGWYYDFGGYQSGWFMGAASGGAGGREDGGWYQPPPLPSGIGTSVDAGGYNYGWHKTGWYAYGSHFESGWDFGYYNVGTGWQYGWFFHYGWEYGWYQYGSWAVGWYYDFGGYGSGWFMGAYAGGYGAAEW